MIFYRLKETVHPNYLPTTPAHPTGLLNPFSVMMCLVSYWEL